MFTKAIEDAQRVPSTTPTAAQDPFDLFSSEAAKAAATPLVETESKEGTFDGVVRVKAVYKARRFFIGRELTAIDENVKIFEPIDETPELAQVMQLVMAGKAVIWKRIESVTATGNVVIWMEWGEYPEKAGDGQTPEERGYMTLAELRNPNVHTPRYKAQVEAEDAPKKSTLPELPEAPPVLETTTIDEDTPNYGADPDAPDWSLENGDEAPSDLGDDEDG